MWKDEIPRVVGNNIISADFATMYIDIISTCDAGIVEVDSAR